MASIIPPKKPRKPGMPKISIPLRPSSSSGGVSRSGSSSSSSSSSMAGQQQPTSHSNYPRTSTDYDRSLAAASAAPPPAPPAPYAAGPSRLREEYCAPHHAHDDGYEGHLPSYSNAASIYPDTVPAGPLTDHQALTNDLRRAIGDGGARTRASERDRYPSRLSRDEARSSYESTRGGGAQQCYDVNATRRSHDGRDYAGSQPPQLPPLFARQASEEERHQQHQRRTSSGGGHGEADTGPSEVPERASIGEATDAYEGRTSSERVAEDDLVLKGNIETLARLGEGASGEVRKGRHRPTGMVMAVKTIATSPNPALHRQILRELSFNRTCHSPFIVRYYGAFLSPDSQSIEICMEFCEAGSLDTIYKKVKSRNGRTGEKILGKVAECVLKGLGYLHDRHIIHRDIKPSNILVTRAGQIKLCDFGVSGELVNSLAGTFTGTSFYMAPERIQGRPYTITSDVWSLGLTILEVASNRFPFPPEGEPPLGPIDLLSYIVSMKTPELQDDAAAGIKWSRALRDFIERCLDKSPETRLGPKKMLTHPFVRKSETRQPQPDVGKFVAEVYGWPVVAGTADTDTDTQTPLTATSTASSMPSSAAWGPPASGSSGSHNSGGASASASASASAGAGAGAGVTAITAAPLDGDAAPAPAPAAAHDAALLARLPSVRRAPTTPAGITPLSGGGGGAGSAHPHPHAVYPTGSTPTLKMPRPPQRGAASGGAGVLPPTGTGSTAAQTPPPPPPPRAPGMTPLERVDNRGRSTEERLEAKMRELDLGICGSPVGSEGGGEGEERGE